MGTLVLILLALVAAGVITFILMKKGKIEDVKEVVEEVKVKAKRVKEEAKDVAKAVKEVGKQAKQVVKAAKTSEPRKGRKPKK